MSKGDYPAYFPKFLRDFHDLKSFTRAFFAYMDLLDKDKRPEHKRRSDMCNWVDFSILLATLIDFLHWLGYDIRVTRIKGEYAPIDCISDLKEFPDIYYSLLNPGGGLAFKKEYCLKVLNRYPGLHKNMPDAVIEKLKEVNNENAS